MNYFTKEWYELCQKIHDHLLLEEDERAESFSEEYFQELYLQKLSEFLDLWQKVSEASNKPFESDKFTKQFEERLIHNQKYLKKMLPEKILKKIADIRVYALNRATRQVVNEVTLFCEDNERSVNKTIKQYNEYYHEALKSFDSNMVKNIHFHDCIIASIEQTENYLSILFDNSGGFTDIYEMKFENYKIVKQDTSIENAWWLYDEIYKTNDRYELHVLLRNKDGELIELTISAKSFSFQRT